LEATDYPASNTQQPEVNTDPNLSSETANGASQTIPAQKLEEIAGTGRVPVSRIASQQLAQDTLEAAKGTAGSTLAQPAQLAADQIAR
jgi:hypothetical protein